MYVRAVLEEGMNDQAILVRSEAGDPHPAGNPRC